ncbi:hypothetical protein MTsPCn5_40150 [Croceitalea sp. MTPC5]|uniref:AbiTii domain-containing protein n=1 Tax=Croceitalea sp. MTPC5 TaxID=3056565 RepID=UPI002B3ABE01|nr:hypothetical protein MTsPCn5_40150 [Croceitalea sp. MTPC5]
MIHQLITDIAYDKINLGQALTRAKLIANQIQNDTFKQWLSKELNGYEPNDTLLPGYRKIWSEIELTAEFRYGQVRSFPVVLPDDADEDLRNNIYFHQAIEPISIVEHNISEMDGHVGYIHLPGGMIRILSKFYTKMVEGQGGQVRSGQRTVGKTQLLNIVERTRQKLLDTLQELENQFPQIDKDYTPNTENEEKVQNIITTHISGNNNPFNVVAGQQVSHVDIKTNITTEEREKLKQWGVEEEAIVELEEIDKEAPKGTPGRKEKIMNWLGRVTASMAGRGIYESIPELVQFIGTIT